MLAALVALLSANAQAATRAERPLITPPSGVHAGARPAGVMIVIHGGAWIITGRGGQVGIAPEAKRYSSYGWLTYNVDYRPGPNSLRDVQHIYDRIHARYRHLPICASGGSAGGHLALMLAITRPGLRCAMSHAGPTDLVTYPSGTVHDAIALWLAPFVDLRSWSPALMARRIHVPVALVYATNDPLVPYAQGTELKRRLPRAAILKLHAGTSPFVHSRVDARDLARAHSAEHRLLARVARAAGRG